MAWNFTNVNAGIDLRKEIENLFHGSADVVPIGQYVIYRRFDLSRKSQYYNEITREAVGGPKYEYTDELVLTYKWNSWVADPFSEAIAKPGILDIPLVTFFFEHDMDPKEQDEVFEFEWDDHHTIKPVLSEITIPYKTRFDIKFVQTFRLDRGRIEFYACRSLKDIVKH